MQDRDGVGLDLAEPLDGPSAARFGPLARELGVVIIVPIFERRAAGLYHNSLMVFDADGANLGTYRKMHIPDDPGFYEKYYFAPGDLGFKSFETRFGRLGGLICWDQWYPEAARLTAMTGASTLFYPTAIGWLPSEGADVGRAQHNAWETIQRSHAVANGCFVVSVNRVGSEPHPDAGDEGSLTEPNDPSTEPSVFWGQSFVADPMGQIPGQGQCGPGRGAGGAH